MAFWAFISFHFGLFRLYFFSFWFFGPSFPFILIFWAFISFHFGVLGLHFLSFWLFGPSFPFILASWAFISLHFGLLGSIFCFCKWQILAKEKLQNFKGKMPFWAKSWPGGLLGLLSFHFGLFRLYFFSLVFLWAFISFHFGFLGLHFLSFWCFGLSFPFILAFWAFISFHFGLLGSIFLLLQMANFGKGKIAKLKGNCRFGPNPGQVAFAPSFSFHFGFLGLHFLSFWSFGPSFPFILAFWVFISFHFGFLGLHFLRFLRKFLRNGGSQFWNLYVFALYWPPHGPN